MLETAPFMSLFLHKKTNVAFSLPEAKFSGTESLGARTSVEFPRRFERPSWFPSCASPGIGAWSLSTTVKR